MRNVLLLSALLLGLSASAAQFSLCPISLTNPDGQELALEKYELRVALNGALSLTEVELVFRNPQERRIEGRFLYLLPAGATLSRFAKEVNGRLMEGEVVEKLRAQSVYTEILHTMRDPALLEMDQGNRFSARVFPIEARATVRLVLSYSQVLPSKNGERKLTVPLGGLPKIGEFTYRIIAPDNATEKLTVNNVLNPANPAINGELQGTSKDFIPQEHLTLTTTATETAPKISALKSGRFQMLSYRFDAPTSEQRNRCTDWTFYIDTSASNADQEQRRLDALRMLLNPFYRLPGLSGRAWVFRGYAFDVTVVPIERSAARSNDIDDPFWKDVEKCVRNRHALGATNLELCLRHIGEQARTRRHDGGKQCFVLISDGIATLGARELKDLLAALGEWPAECIMHALVLGSKQDDKVLAAITEKTHGRVIQVPLDSKMESVLAQVDPKTGRGPKVFDELCTNVGASFEFYDEGAAWIFPKTFRDVRPGDELIVFSQLKDGAAAKPGVLQRGLDGKVIKDQALESKPEELADFEPLLQREACRALLDHLEKLEQNEKDAAKKAELHTQRIQLSTKNRVLCPLTSLLVLETEADYQRFGIERTSLADIMIVGKSGIELKKRGPEDVPAAVPPLTQRASKGLSEKKQKDAEQRADDKAGALRPGAAPAAVEALDGKAESARGWGGAGERSREALAAEPQGGNALRATAPSADADNLIGTSPPSPRTSAEPRSEAATTGRPERSQQAQQNRAGERRPEETAPLIPAFDPSELESTNRRLLEDSLSPDVNSRTVIEPPQAKVALPAWCQQFNQSPSDAQLDALRAKVQGSERDRTLRNAYSDALFKAGKWDSLQGEAFQWLPFDPENPQVYEFLGKSATGLKDYDLALRAMTSIAEIAPNRAALLARAGWLLLTARKYTLAAELFRESVKNRKDDPNLYRGLALSLWLDKKHDEAATTLEDAIKNNFHGRYGDVLRVMREELGYILRSWAAAEKNSDHAKALAARAAKSGVSFQHSDGLRVTLCWETDACDVDLHVVDPAGEECYYQRKNNNSGLQLYSDQTQGLGPEVIRTEKALKGVYHVGVNYFSAGAMGVSRGVVVVFQPVNGLVEQPVIVPFCLMPGGAELRHIVAVEF